VRELTFGFEVEGRLMTETHRRYSTERNRIKDVIFETNTVLHDLERRNKGHDSALEVVALRLALDEVRLMFVPTSDLVDVLRRAEAMRGLAATLWQQHRI
jgi:hypothetical protein